MINTPSCTPLEAIEIIEQLWSLRLAIMLWGPPGVGKCLGRNTPVLMFDGTVKAVQDVREGDLLMGDDSTPRKVSATTNGVGKLFLVTPKKGDPYVINDAHILSLKRRSRTSKLKQPKTETVDIAVRDYLNSSITFKHQYKGYRVGVEFPAEPVRLDPYILGYWLGDGDSHDTAITTQDREIVEHFSAVLQPLGLVLRASTTHTLRYSFTTPERNGRGHKQFSNPFRNALRSYELLKNKHIPHKYKCNSREVRLKLLAGLVDSDGFIGNGCYCFTFKSETLARDATYLCRSLGFAAYMKPCSKSWTSPKQGNKYSGSGTYYSITVSGAGLDQVPVLLERKRVRPRRQVKNALSTGIRVTSHGVGEYYGFELDGNGRFLLGDFTVTHNSQLVAQLAERRKAVLHDVRLSQKTAADIGGLPALDHETRQTIFYVPEFLPRGGGEQILFLDELTTAEQLTQVAAYGLVLERRVGNYTLPEGVRVLAASNRLEDGAVSSDMGTALNDRFVHLVIEPTAKDWLQWAVGAGVCREVMAFIQVRPDLLSATNEMRQNDHAVTPSPRSWERVSTVYTTIKSRRMREVTISGIVGDATAYEFMTIAEEVSTMASVEKILETNVLNLHNVIPTSLNGLYGLAYALAAAVDPKTLGPIMEVVNALDELKGRKHDGLPMADIQALAGSVVLERALKLKIDCSEHPAFMKFDGKRRGDQQQIQEAA